MLKVNPKVRISVEKKIPKKLHIKFTITIIVHIAEKITKISVNMVGPFIYVPSLKNDISHTIRFAR